MASNAQNELKPAVLPAEQDIEMGTYPIEKMTSKRVDSFLVTFDLPFDDENPKDWPMGQKWAVTDVLSATGFIRIMVSTIMAPALPIIAKEFKMNKAESVMAMSSELLIAETFVVE